MYTLLGTAWARDSMYTLLGTAWARDSMYTLLGTAWSRSSYKNCMGVNLQLRADVHAVYTLMETASGKIQLYPTVGDSFVEA
jgi:hypothetical protein